MVYRPENISPLEDPGVAHRKFVENYLPIERGLRFYYAAIDENGVWHTQPAQGKQAAVIRQRQRALHMQNRHGIIDNTIVSTVNAFREAQTFLDNTKVGFVDYPEQ